MSLNNSQMFPGVKSSLAIPVVLFRLSISAGQRSVRYAARVCVSGRCPCPEFASESISVNVHVSLCVLESVSLSMNVCVSYGW